MHHLNTRPNSNISIKCNSSLTPLISINGLLGTDLLDSTSIANFNVQVIFKDRHEAFADGGWTSILLGLK